MAMGYEEVEMSIEDDVGCSTPTREEYRIQVGPVPPPPPRKKPVVLLEKKRLPPENGYFLAPDLDMLFAVGPIRRQACA